MKENHQSYLEASNDYYQDLSSGTTNRAAEFKENVDFEHVKKVVTDSNGVPNQAIDENAENLKPGDSLTKSLSPEEKEEILKKKVPAAYNFLESLENNQNDFQEYVAEEGAE